MSCLIGPGKILLEQHLSEVTAVLQSNRRQQPAELVDSVQVERHSALKQFSHTFLGALGPRPFLVALRTVALLWRINAEEFEWKHRMYRPR